MFGRAGQSVGLKLELSRDLENRKAASFLLPVSHAAYHRVTPPKAFAPPSIYRAFAWGVFYGCSRFSDTSRAWL